MNKYYDLRNKATGVRYNVTKPYVEGITIDTRFYELPDGSPATFSDEGAIEVGEWVLCDYPEEEIKEQKIKKLQEEYFPLFDANALLAGRLLISGGSLTDLQEYDNQIKQEYETKLKELI